MSSHPESSGTADRAGNAYHNAPNAAQPNPVVSSPDAVDLEFFDAANAVLASAAELVRTLVGAHQGAAAIVVQHDWATARKHFSLSPRYAAWAGYAGKAVGYGSHAWLLRAPGTVRLTQAELEAHPEWRNFGTEAGKHPPMRGWLATQIRGRDGTVWGLLQLSDKYDDGEFTAEDEAAFVRFAALVSTTLEALWEVRNLRKAGAPR